MSKDKAGFPGCAVYAAAALVLLALGGMTGYLALEGTRRSLPASLALGVAISALLLVGVGTLLPPLARELGRALRGLPFQSGPEPLAGHLCSRCGSADILRVAYRDLSPMPGLDCGRCQAQYTTPAVRVFHVAVATAAAIFFGWSLFLLASGEGRVRGKGPLLLVALPVLVARYVQLALLPGLSPKKSPGAWSELDGR
jgi:hypothetical protein